MITKLQCLEIIKRPQVDGVVTTHINEMIEVIRYYIFERKGVTINNITYTGQTVFTPSKFGVFPIQDIQLILYCYETATKWILAREFNSDNSL